MRLIVDFFGAEPTGSVVMTRSFLTSADACWIVSPTTNPLSVSAFLAASTVLPVTTGTTSEPAPVEMRSSTSLPVGAGWPAGGEVSTALPSSTVSDSNGSTFTMNLRSVSALVASASERFTTGGMTTLAGPVLTKISTSFPLARRVLAAGF